MHETPQVTTMSPSFGQDFKAEITVLNATEKQLVSVYCANVLQYKRELAQNLEGIGRGCTCVYCMYVCIIHNKGICLNHVQELHSVCNGSCDY